jgi:hypothetical protein
MCTPPGPALDLLGESGALRVRQDRACFNKPSRDSFACLNWRITGLDYFVNSWMGFFWSCLQHPKDAGVTFKIFNNLGTLVLINQNGPYLCILLSWSLPGVNPFSFWIWKILRVFWRRDCFSLNNMGQGYRVGGPEVINQLLCFLFCGARD